MNIPFTDLKLYNNNIFHQKFQEALRDIMASGQYILGENLKTAERYIARETGCHYAIGMNSGTDALILLLRALDIGYGDEVIIPANVFFSVANAVCILGAHPVFCDVRYDDMLVDVKKIPSVITKKTKAIIAVHLTGMPCDMDEINEIADSFGIPVIEDAAQAIGALYKGKKVGSLGIAACFSFHPLKNIRALGDGGAVVTNDRKLFTVLRELRNHGLNAGEVVRPGYNSRLDEIHAAAVGIQLQDLDHIRQTKRKIAKKYTAGIGDAVEINAEPDYKKGAYQLYMIKTKERDQLQTYLAEKGISTAVHYRKYIPFHSYYIDKYGLPEHLSITERLSREVLSLPIYYSLSDSQLGTIISAIRNYKKKA